MTTLSALERATEILSPWTRWSKPVGTNQVVYSMSRDSLVDAVQALIDAHWGYLSAIVGLDEPGVETTTSEEMKWERLSSEQVSEHNVTATQTRESFVVLYCFCAGDAIATIRVHPPTPEEASVPTICGVIPSATLYERELMELLGIEVVGTPDTSRLILPENWPAGVYPMRKSFKGLEKE